MPSPRFVDRSGLSQDDPLFLALVATRKLEAILEEAPVTLKLLLPLAYLLALRQDSPNGNNCRSVK